MSMNGKILARAFEEKSRMRTLRETMSHHKRAELFAKFPQLEENEKRLRQTAAEAALAALTRRDPEETARLKKENLSLQQQEAGILLANGYPADYLNDKPQCEACADSGYHGVKVCTCVRQIYAQLQTEELDRQLDFTAHCFEKFDLEMYSSTVDSRRGISARENMENILAYCREYAANLSRKSPNLAFFGGTGLGKTFLSSCIAKTVSERGIYVAYMGASGMIDGFEQEKFYRADREDITAPAMESDLLIIDDLGTEMVTQFTLSCLYTVLNTRLVNGKKTVISSNLSLDDLRRTYTPQIMSRIEGEFRNLTFFGEDIRIKRRNRF